MTPAHPQPDPERDEHAPERHDVEAGRCQQQLFPDGSVPICGNATHRLPSGEYARLCTDCGGPSGEEPAAAGRCTAYLWTTPESPPCFQPTRNIDTLLCPDCGGPPLDSRPREAIARDSAGGPSLPQKSPGGDHTDTAAMLDCLVDGLINSIWLLAGKDARTSVDLIERAIAKLQEEWDTDLAAARRKAKSKGREQAAREGTPS